MNLYGDKGNIRAVIWTLNQMNIEVVYQEVEVGTKLPAHTDWYFIGGGQDRSQILISDDFIKKSHVILNDVKNNKVPLLAICGGYQLLGEEFVTGDGVTIQGAGLFPVITKAIDDHHSNRCIGDLVVKSTIDGLDGVYLVGFENHSGQTYIQDGAKESYIGDVVYGNGNNFEQKVEGFVVNNAIGTYMHGSCLPKNPELTELIISKALAVRGGDISQFTFPDQSIALKAKAERLRILL